MKKLVILFAMVFAVSTAMAQSNTSTITQSDATQTATVGQQGGDNESVVTQSNSLNTATVTQVNYQYEPGVDLVKSTVLQSGVENTATVEQTHSRGGAYPGNGGLIETRVEQTGDYNTSMQIQGPNNQMGNDYAEVLQSGNNNNAYQIQYRQGNDAYIDQAGSDNTARQAQDTELPDEREGSSNLADIYQGGSDNYAEQEQQGWSNEAYIDQTGDGNNASQLQLSWQGEAHITQSGSGNTASQKQYSGGASLATIVQSSSGNTASQTQTSVARHAGEGGIHYNLNVAEIYQMRDTGNEAIQIQTSPGGEVDMNFATVTQDGAGNFASQTQFGGFNISSISQTGTGHSAVVTQSQLLP